MLRIGLIGAGANTRARHLPGFRALPEVEVVAVANRTPESGRRAAAELGIARAHATWRDLIGDPAIDAVCIGAWPDLHAPATLAALAAGKHVLCEARLAMDLAEARAMRAGAQAAPHLVAQVVPSPATLAVDATICRLLAAGAIGPLVAVDLVQHGGFADAAAPLHWRQDARRSGLNTMALGIWYEALLRWGVRAERVVARSRVLVPRRRDADGSLHAVAVPDHLEVIGDCAGGATLHLRLSQAIGLGPPGGIWLHGLDGTLHVDLGGQTVALGRRGDAALAAVDIPAGERGAWRVEEDFVASIREGRPVTRTSFADGVAYMAFTQAVAEASTHDRVVAVERA